MKGGCSKTKKKMPADWRKKRKDDGTKKGRRVTLYDVEGMEAREGQKVLDTYLP